MKTKENLSLYEKAIAILPPSHIDHHESDLYLKHSKESALLIAEYEFKEQVTPFIDNIDHAKWYDIPFAYDPFWQEKCRKEG